MKIKIIAVGKIKGPEQALIERYSKRLPWALNIIEIDERQRQSGPQQKIREAEAIRARLPSSAPLIALSEHGKLFSSRAFAKTIDRYQEDAHKELVFLIGGADGLAEALLERSDIALSFGPMTWPHMMARSMLVEQLYRAASIMAGHPYHRD